MKKSGVLCIVFKKVQNISFQTFNIYIYNFSFVSAASCCACLSKQTKNMGCVYSNSIYMSTL